MYIQRIYTKSHDSKDIASSKGKCIFSMIPLIIHLTQLVFWLGYRLWWEGGGGGDRSTSKRGRVYNGGDTILIYKAPVKVGCLEIGDMDFERLRPPQILFEPIQESTLLTLT